MQIRLLTITSGSQQDVLGREEGEQNTQEVTAGSGEEWTVGRYLEEETLIGVEWGWSRGSLRGSLYFRHNAALPGTAFSASPARLCSVCPKL